MLLIFQALALYSKISPWNSKNNIPHILPPCQKKTLLFSLSQKKKKQTLAYVNKKSAMASKQLGLL